MNVDSAVPGEGQTDIVVEVSLNAYRLGTHQTVQSPNYPTCGKKCDVRSLNSVAEEDTQ